MTKKWIQKANIKKGALKEYLKREAPHVLNSDGTINYTKLKEWYNKHKDHLSTTTKRRINLAFTLKKLKK
jgi:uncharacterized protein (UPF0216 family)